MLPCALKYADFCIASMEQPPQAWSDEWAEALAFAQKNVMFVRSGLKAAEFAALAGVHPNTVGKYARKGLAQFQAKFGEGCSFERVVQAGGETEEWICTFAASIRLSADAPPIPGLIRSSEFCEIHGIKSIEIMNFYTTRGHAWFRNRFPGWDFLEVSRLGNAFEKGSQNIVRWYGTTDILGEQPEAEIPNDHLTERQFGLLKQIGVRYLSALCRHEGLAKFELKYPGWSFREEGGEFIYFRTGPEVETLKLKQFAERMGVTRSYLYSLIKNNRFSKEFPYWEVHSLPVPNSKSMSWSFRPISTQTFVRKEEEAIEQGIDEFELDSSSDSPTVSTIQEVSSDEWQMALAKARLEMMQFHTGLDINGFASLIGRTHNWVNALAKKGLETFKDACGNYCHFEEIEAPHLPWSFRRMYTFFGYVHPVALIEAMFGLRLFSEAEFASMCSLKPEEVQDLVQRGVFQQECTGWDFLEVENPRDREFIRLYGYLEDIDLVKTQELFMA